MTNWKRTTQELPIEGSKVSIYFYHTGYDICEYSRELDEQNVGPDGKEELFYYDTFSSKKGWLSDEDLLWSYDLEATNNKWPIPASYLDDKKFRSQNPDPKIREEHDSSRFYPKRLEDE